MLSQYNLTLAGLEIATAKCRKYGHVEDSYLLTILKVDKEHRGKGYGSQLLKLVCAAADKEEVDLYVFACPFDGCPFDREVLEDWYKRHGFVERSKYDRLVRVSPTRSVKPPEEASKSTSDPSTWSDYDSFML